MGVDAARDQDAQASDAGGMAPATLEMLEGAAAAAIEKKGTLAAAVNHPPQTPIVLDGPGLRRDTHVVGVEADDPVGVSATEDERALR